jgi:hypothetical protein
MITRDTLASAIMGTPEWKPSGGRSNVTAAYAMADTVIAALAAAATTPSGADAMDAARDKMRRALIGNRCTSPDGTMVHAETSKIVDIAVHLFFFPATPPAQHDEGAMRDTRPDIFACNVGNDGKVRIIDLIYTAFMRAKATKGNPDDNGPFDWFTDTYPAMAEQIGKWATEYRVSTPAPVAREALLHLADEMKNDGLHGTEIYENKLRALALAQPPAIEAGS